MNKKRKITKKPQVCFREEGLAGMDTKDFLERIDKKIKINNINYEFEDIKIYVMGVEIKDIKGIEYKQ